VKAMKWTQRLQKARDHIAIHHAMDREEHRMARLRREQFKMKQKSLRLQQRELERRLKLLYRLKGDHTDEVIALYKQIAQVKAEFRDLHIRQHYSGFNDHGEDFQQYYRHIRYTRPVFLIVNLSLWFFLFWYGGLATGFRIVVLLFAISTTIGSVFEFIFTMKIKDRILDPVDKLKRGVLEISKGHYDVTVEEGFPNEVTPLIRAFNDMAQKLKQGEALKAEYEENRRQLIANISHDLKTPITSIQGYVEALAEGVPDDKQARYLSIVHHNTLYMNRLIDDLFLFSMLDMQKLDFHFESVKIRSFAADMMEEFKLYLEEKNIRFSFEDALSDDCMAKLDTRRFYQVVRNIISNAEKHADNGNLHIEAKLFRDNGSLRLSIADNGPGIPEGSLDHIFERFYRADRERTKDLNSTGLGLAIAKELIEAHRGTITASNQKDKGCVFTVSLPVLEAEPKENLP